MKKFSLRRPHDIFSLAGWLFADLLLVLTLLFLVSAAPWQPPNPPPPPQLICGVAKTAKQVYVNVPDPSGLIKGSSHGVKTFQTALRKTVDAKLGALKGRVAGLVIVFGGGDIQHGQDLAQGAINAMKKMPNYVFTSKTAYFRNLWNGNINSNQVEVNVFYYISASSCG